MFETDNLDMVGIEVVNIQCLYRNKIIGYNMILAVAMFEMSNSDLRYLLLSATSLHRKKLMLSPTGSH